MAASVDTPRRRSPRLALEGGAADNAPATPDARALGPRTRLSEGSRSLRSSAQKSGVRSPRRVSNGSGGRGKWSPSTRSRTRGHSGDGPPGVRGPPSGPSQGPVRAGHPTEIMTQSPSAASENPNSVHNVAVKPRRSRECSQVNGGASCGDAGSPISGSVLGKAAPSTVAKGTDNLGPGPYTVAKGTDHSGLGPSTVAKGTSPVGRGPSTLAKETDNFGSGPSTVPKGTSHVGPGPSTVPKGTSHVGPGPSTVPKGTSHVGPEPSTVTKATDNVRTEPFMVAKRTDHVLPGPSTERKGTNPEGPGPSTLAKEMDYRMPVTQSGRVGLFTGTTVKDLEKAGPSSHRKSKKTGPSRLNASREKLKADQSAHCSPVKHKNLPPAGATSGPAFPRNHKVHCGSKKWLQQVLARCTEIGREVLESQQQLSQERRQLEHRNFVRDFETAFQENISINGQSWHEAPDPDEKAEPDIKILEDQLDDAIVETAMKRRRYPNKVLRQFVKGLKVERELLDHYKPVIRPQNIKLDVAQEFSRMCLTDKADVVFQQISETMKALPIQLEKAEGFSQVLSLQPVLEASRVRQDIFSSRVVVEDVAKTQPKPLETTPCENEPQTNTAPALKLKRQQTPSNQNILYPLRSKRKISLEA